MSCKGEIRVVFLFFYFLKKEKRKKGRRGENGVVLQKGTSQPNTGPLNDLLTLNSISISNIFKKYPTLGDSLNLS